MTSETGHGEFKYWSSIENVRGCACSEGIREGRAHVALKTVWEASADGTRAAGNGSSMSAAPPRPAPGSTLLLGFHHLFVRGWGRVAVGRGWGVGYAPLGGVGLNLESHRHGIHGRIHAGSSGVGVIGQPWRLGS